MAETIRQVDYFYVMSPDKPGEAARMLDHLRRSGINLLAFSGFPGKAKQAQLDFIPENAQAFQDAARQAKWKLKGPKKGFLVQGDDRVGAVADLVKKLGDAKINITATDAVCAGAGRYGVIFWVKPRDVGRAAKTLGIG
jgi:hypothetical protein